MSTPQTKTLSERLARCISALDELDPVRLQGRVVGALGLSIDIAGLSNHAAVGERLQLRARDGSALAAEIVGFRGDRAQGMAFGRLEGLGAGTPVRLVVGRQWLDSRRGVQSIGAAAIGAGGGTLAVSDRWLGRVLDPIGQPLDGRGEVPAGPQKLPVRRAPPDATGRARLGPRLDLGVRALNLFTTCCRGQRLGLFAASGVGKSTLLATLARQTECDVIVLALVGERGREVREFLEEDLGTAGLARSVVIVATSDAPPLLRRQAGYAAMTVAEYFRDQGKSVLLLMDSISRFALALREIGLSAGEPPATRGYPPSVFAELPRLLERAGPGPGGPDGANPGFITALFTVLVEGEDPNEPIADAVRGLLDGHVMLTRRIAEGGRYPAIDVLRSLSRAAPTCNGAEEQALLRRARMVLSTYADIADLVRLGAYRTGSDAAVDEAVLLTPRIEQVLRQDRDERSSIEEGFAMLAAALQP